MRSVHRSHFNGTRSVPASLRSGVTLVELLVVIFIMLAITAIAIPVVAPAMKNRDVREAARMIDVFINGARARALQSGHSYGVMLERMPGQPNGCVTLSYCEQPDPYQGDFAASASFPGMPAASGGSTILLLGNGGFGAWSALPTLTTPGAVSALTAFPLGDMGWIAGPNPQGGTGWLTNIAPGDILSINGGQYVFRIWAGEPFIDLDQNGMCNQCTGSLPGTPGTPTQPVQEPFLDVDGNGAWTPPNPPPGQAGNVAGMPYVDPGSGYFVQPNAAVASPFPVITWGAASAFVTYAPYDPMQAATTISNAFVTTLKYASSGFPLPSNVFQPTNPSVVGALQSFQFSFQRRPVKTSAPSIELPGGAVIDLGANFPYDPPGQPVGNIIPIPGSGVEVLAANANGLGLWATFDCNPLLDPTLNGQITGVAAQNPPPTDTTSIIITFQPSGTVDKIYSWSEINTVSLSGTTPNWSDWQGRIPAGPIYLLVGRQELINGDPTLLPLIQQNLAPHKPVFNVQDPSALWVTIDPQTGAVATAENVGFNLDIAPVSVGTPNFNSMFVYWNANAYYARRLARAMLDMGGR